MSLVAGPGGTAWLRILPPWHAILLSGGTSDFHGSRLPSWYWTLHTIRRNNHDGEPVRSNTVLHYRSLRVNELENAIGKMLERIEGGLGRVDAEVRDQLLPALMVMREKVKPGHWQEFLRAHRLNPATVRQWRARQKATTASLLHLFGESRMICLKKKAARLGETPDEALLKAAKRGFEELLKGNVKYASELAKDFLEAYAMVGPAGG